MSPGAIRPPWLKCTQRCTTLAAVPGNRHLPGCNVGILPALKDGACRASGQFALDEKGVARTPGRIVYCPQTGIGGDRSALCRCEANEGILAIENQSSRHEWWQPWRSAAGHIIGGCCHVAVHPLCRLSVVFRPAPDAAQVYTA